MGERTDSLKNALSVLQKEYQCFCQDREKKASEAEPSIEVSAELQKKVAKHFKEMENIYPKWCERHFVVGKPSVDHESVLKNYQEMFDDAAFMQWLGHFQLSQAQLAGFVTQLSPSVSKGTPPVEKVNEMGDPSQSS